MTNRITNTAADFQLDHDDFGKLVLVEADGTRHVGVTPVRGFPISDPQHGLSLLSAEGRELAWIEDLALLPPAARNILETELAQREFLPQIRRILSVSLQTDPCEWEVETDRGQTKFVLKSEDDIRRLDAQRAMVVDAHGVHYLIPDTRALDRHSRQILERYL
jgi:hypothetical protein